MFLVDVEVKSQESPYSFYSLFAWAIIGRSNMDPHILLNIKDRA